MPEALHTKYRGTMINLTHNCYYIIKELDKLKILLESKRKEGNKCSEDVAQGQIASKIENTTQSSVALEWEI